MKAIFNRVQGLLVQYVNDSSQRGDVLTTAVALAQSRTLSIPSTAVIQPAEYYNTQVLSSVSQELGALNEEIVFDLRCAMNECRQFWMIRYVAAHPCGLPFVSDVGFIDTLVGAGIYLDKDLHAFLNEHKEAILRLECELRNIMLNEPANRDVRIGAF